MTKLDRSLLVLLIGCGGTDTDPPVHDVDAGVDLVDAAVDATVDAFVTPPCSPTADTCTGESICIAGACEAAFGRIYDIRALAVTLPTLDPNGYTWDFGGGAPDIFVVISVNGVTRATTATVNDQFSATLPGPYPVEPVGGGSLRLVAYDEDININDFAFACATDPLTAAQLRARSLSCASGGSTLNFTIEPR